MPARNRPHPDNPDRSVRDRAVVLGVCARLSDFLKVDVALIRAIWIMAVIATGGAAAVPYIVVEIVRD